MKLKEIKYFQIISVVYAALYLTAVISYFTDRELSFSKLINSLFLLLFLIFIVGFTLLWTREKIAGIILMAWNTGVWIWDLVLVRGQDSGMLCIMAVPVLVIGALLVLRWYKINSILVPTVQKQWKFILRVLIINYAVLYTIVVISELSSGKPPDYLSIPFILFPLMLLIFYTGFALAWNSEFYAGIIFLLWCAVMLFGAINYPEFRNSGPWILFGLPILLQGLFYIKNHFQYKLKR